MFNSIIGIFLFIMGNILLVYSGELSTSILIVNMHDEAVLPRNFRTVEDKFKLGADVLPSQEGLRTLRMSGSGQFSDKSLKSLLLHLGNPKNFYVVDLRQEYHGFLNGKAVSWYGVRNRQNVGKPLDKIESEELILLQKALASKDIILSKVAFKDTRGLDLPSAVSIPIVVKDYATEKEVATRYGVNYFRIPTTDCCCPTDEMIDRFITFVKSLPQERWLHFHCSAGVGRTTSYMAMYDILINAKTVSFVDILKRQNLLGGKGLDDLGSPSNWKYESYVKRLDFLQRFYSYCRNDSDNYVTSWTVSNKK